MIYEVREKNLGIDGMKLLCMTPLFFWYFPQKQESRSDLKQLVSAGFLRIEDP